MLMDTARKRKPGVSYSKTPQLKSLTEVKATYVVRHKFLHYILYIYIYNALSGKVAKLSGTPRTRFIREAVENTSDDKSELPEVAQLFVRINKDASLVRNTCPLYHQLKS